MTRRILPLGDHALLVELDDLDAVLGLFRGLDATRPEGVVDLVPAARTIAAASVRATDERASLDGLRAACP